MIRLLMVGFGVIFCESVLTRGFFYPDVLNFLAYTKCILTEQYGIG